MRAREFIIEGIEERIALIAKQMGPRILGAANRDTNFRTSPETTAEDVVRVLSQADPSGVGKNLQFIVRMYANGDIRIEDIERTKQEVAQFISSVPKLKKAGKSVDINAFHSRADMLAAIDSVADERPMVSKRVQTKQIKTEGAKKIISDSTLSVYQILTQEAACFYGAGTKWCTAGQKDNAFDQYNRQGPIYVILTDGRKFQLHVESSQFMNEQDSAVSKTDIAMLSKSPAYTKFLNMLIKKHYGKFLGI